MCIRDRYYSLSNISLVGGFSVTFSGFGNYKRLLLEDQDYQMCIRDSFLLIPPVVLFLFSQKSVIETMSHSGIK